MKKAANKITTTTDKYGYILVIYKWKEVQEDYVELGIPYNIKIK